MYILYVHILQHDVLHSNTETDYQIIAIKIHPIARTAIPMPHRTQSTVRESSVLSLYLLSIIVQILTYYAVRSTVRNMRKEFRLY